MKRVSVTLAVLLLSAAPLFAKKSDDETRTGGTRFVPYEGKQEWPTSKSPEITQSHAVPVYEGLPNKPYKVIGRIIDDREGIDLVGKELGGFFGGSKKRFRECANQAKLNGGDALVITDDARVVDQFELSRKERKETSPLAKDRDHLVLVVKF